MNPVRLGVNIDHVATLRQVRRTVQPDPVFAAFLAEQAGADGITIHLREDRRHINERDLRLLKETVRARVNLEMGVAEEILRIALDVKPHAVCLVPERREELTTEGGLDVRGALERTKGAVLRLREAGIVVSAFIDAVPGQIEAAKAAGAEFVEIHTGPYAATGADEAARNRELALVAEAARFARSVGLRVNAGHGLDYVNVRAVAALPEVEELNIGHAIVARAVYSGLPEAVREMKRLIVGARSS